MVGVLRIASFLLLVTESEHCTVMKEKKMHWVRRPQAGLFSLQVLKFNDDDLFSLVGRWLVLYSFSENTSLLSPGKN